MIRKHFLFFSAFVFDFFNNNIFMFIIFCICYESRWLFVRFNFYILYLLNFLIFLLFFNLLFVQLEHFAKERAILIWLVIPVLVIIILLITPLQIMIYKPILLFFWFSYFYRFNNYIILIFWSHNCLNIVNWSRLHYWIQFIIFKIIILCSNSLIIFLLYGSKSWLYYWFFLLIAYPKMIRPSSTFLFFTCFFIRSFWYSIYFYSINVILYFARFLLFIFDCSLKYLTLLYFFSICYTIIIFIFCPL